MILYLVFIKFHYEILLLHLILKPSLCRVSSCSVDLKDSEYLYVGNIVFCSDKTFAYFNDRVKKKGPKVHRTVPASEDESI